MITVIGGLTIDLTYILNDWPKPNSAVQAENYTLKPGGKGLNFAVATKRLGLNPNLIASVGYDHFGRSVIEALIDERITTDNVLQKNVETSLVGIILNQKSSEPGFIGSLKGTYSLERIDIIHREKDIQNSKFLIVNNEINPEVLSTSLKLAKKHNVPTIFNPAPPLKTDLSNIFPLVDYLFLNEWEGNFYLPKRNNKEQIKEFLNLGIQNVIITKSKKGCIFGSKEKIITFSAYTVKAIDETGAGDAFMAGFLYCLNKRKSIEESLIFGSACGAITTTKVGSYSGMPTLNSVNTFLATNPPLK